jgi:hypothetical protein
MDAHNRGYGASLKSVDDIVRISGVGTTNDDDTFQADPANIDIFPTGTA